jgi:hypothetical protein
MAEVNGENPLDGIKEVINEVVELLNQPNLPVAVNDDDAEAGEPGVAKA